MRTVTSQETELAGIGKLFCNFLFLMSLHYVGALKSLLRHSSCAKFCQSCLNLLAWPTGLGTIYIP
jgi:hypothetical protein